MSTPTKDARPPRLCPHCFAGTPPEATTCWLCQSQLPAYEQRPASDAGVAPRIAGSAPTRTTPNIEVDFVLWILATVIASLLLVVLVVDVGALGGVGYAAIAIAISAPVLSALGAMVWLRRPSNTPASTTPGREPMSRVLGTVALTVTSVLAVIGLIGLLVLALLVLAFLACIGAMGGGSI